MTETVQIHTEETPLSLKEQVDNLENKDLNEEKKEKILGKFESYEELEKSYSELEKKLGGGGLKKTLKEEAADQETVEEKARDVVQDAGLNFDSMRSYYNEHGTLDETDYKALEKNGIPRFLVDEFISGQEARTALLEKETFSSVGGEESYRVMTDWAASVLSEEEISIFNSEVNSGNSSRIKFAVNGLKARYEKASGFEPSRSLSGKTSPHSASSYSSWAQVKVDMSDTRYSNDPAFRREVEAKLSRSRL